MSTVITLPFPISVNKTFKKHNGRHLSEEYRDWRDAAGAELIAQDPEPVPGRVIVEIALNPPDKRIRDIDNHFKGVLDLLKSHRVIQDDDHRFVRKVVGEWVETGAPCTVTVRRLAA